MLRFKVIPDDDPDLSWLEQWNTPETYAGNECLDEDGNVLSFDDYMATYGDPDRHVTLALFTERKCETCGHWETVDCLGGIDFMDWDCPDCGTFELEELTGYLLEIAKETIPEVG